MFLDRRKINAIDESAPATFDSGSFLIKESKIQIRTIVIVRKHLKENFEISVDNQNDMWYTIIKDKGGAKYGLQGN